MALSSAVTLPFPTNAVDPAPFTSTQGGTPLSFTTPVNLVSTSTTYDQLLFNVACPSVVTLFFSGTLGNYARNTPRVNLLYAISLTNAAFPSTELNPISITTSEEVAYTGATVTDSSGNTYVYPVPLSLTASFTLQPGTYVARLNIQKTDTADLVTPFYSFIGGNMTARIVKINA